MMLKYNTNRKQMNDNVGCYSRNGGCKTTINRTISTSINNIVDSWIMTTTTELDGDRSSSNTNANPQRVPLDTKKQQQVNTNTKSSNFEDNDDDYDFGFVEVDEVLADLDTSLSGCYDFYSSNRGRGEERNSSNNRDASSPTTVAVTPFPSKLSLSLRTNTVASEPNLHSHHHRRNKKRVRFASQVGMRRILSHKDMTQNERCNSWVQYDEFQSSIEESHRIIKTMEQQEQEKQDKRGLQTHHTLSVCCSRGLESTLESLQRKANILKGLESVLVTQETTLIHVPVSDGTEDYYIYNDEAIAAVYQTIAHTSKLRAEQIAIQDRKAIENYIVLQE